MQPITSNHFTIDDFPYLLRATGTPDTVEYATYECHGFHSLPEVTGGEVESIEFYNEETKHWEDVEVWVFEALYKTAQEAINETTQENDYEDIDYLIDCEKECYI